MTVVFSDCMNFLGNGLEVNGIQLASKVYSVPLKPRSLPPVHIISKRTCHEQVNELRGSTCYKSWTHADCAFPKLCMLLYYTDIKFVFLFTTEQRERP